MLFEPGHFQTVSSQQQGLLVALAAVLRLWLKLEKVCPLFFKLFFSNLADVAFEQKANKKFRVGGFELG